MSIRKASQQYHCFTLANGKGDAFKILKESKIKINPDIHLITDTRYQGIQKLLWITKQEIAKTKQKPLNKTAQAQKSITFKENRPLA